MLKTTKFRIYFLAFFLFFSSNLFSSGYNSFGHSGLINLPNALIKEEQSAYLTLTRSSYTKYAAITVTPFHWLEASFFYSRPDDLLWGGAKGLYLDKGFNVKFSYDPQKYYLPKFGIGLDDFAGTGQLSKEYIVATYNFRNLDFTSGIGWGKFVGESGPRIKNPLSYLHDGFNQRDLSSIDDLGGTPAYGAWFRGDATLFAGVEYYIPKIKGLSFKLETDPYNYFDFLCCGEGKSPQSLVARKKDSDINFGLSFKYKDFGSINIGYLKGNTWTSLTRLIQQ